MAIVLPTKILVTKRAIDHLYSQASHVLTYSKRAIAGLASGIDEGRSSFPAKTFATKRAIGPTLSGGD
jgi:hypothetical protein